MSFYQNNDNVPSLSPMGPRLRVEPPKFQLRNFLDTMKELDSDAYDTNFPPADIYTEGDEESLIFEFAIAGYDPANIKVSAANSAIEIYTVKPDEEKGDAEADDEIKPKRIYSKHKIAHRDFHLKYVLAPGYFNLNNIKANYSNGILKIELPRSEESKPVEVRIETA